ncbi:unnamed protein product [Peniophora sp. CBMAI 1063]|nr:unnamed protein product [Peniophora sp. CBMAI 1063]
MADASKPSKGVAQRLLGVVPDWVSSNLTSSRSLKTWFRAWLAAWAALILLLPNASITTMGNTAFYALLMGTAFIPASAPIQLFLIMLVTAIGGTCMGWALGAAAMRAALAARDQHLLQSTLLKAQESAAGYANPEAVIQLDVFQGLFLDTRSSVVYGVFLIAACFFFGLVRTYAPPLIFFSLFGTIAIDIFCTIGPLFPAPQYLILNSLLISAAMYSAIAIFVIIFIFPQTVNHAYLSLLSRLLGVVTAVMSVQNEILLDSRGMGQKLEKAQTLRTAMFALLRGLKSQAGLLNAEFTWGRMSGEDVASFQDPLTDVVARLNALMVFVKLSHKSYTRARGTPTEDNDDSDSEKASDGSSKASLRSIPSTTETYLIQQWRTRHTAIQEEHHLHFADLLPVLQSTTADVRKSMLDGISAVQASLAFANENRYRTPWTKRKDSSVIDSQLDNACDALSQALKEFKATRRLELLAPYQTALQSQSKGIPMLPGLHVNYVYSASLVLVAEAALALTEHVRTLLSQRARNRLWAPTGLRALAHAMTKRPVEEEEEVAAQEDVPVGQTDFASYRKDPDTRSVRGPIQRLFSTMRQAYAWSFSPNGLYVLRYCVVTFALWLPAVFKTSAEFYYKQKGVWGLIMAQMTIGYFIGEHLSVYFTRILGTIAGLVVGLLIWYIGNGHGTGNPYGFAASSAVFLAPLMFIRVFVPAKHMPSALILNATAALVIGYSWLNTHLPVISFGYGWSIAWRRFLLVVIGCVASFIVMFVPPKSARKAVRVRNATAISGLSNIYLDLTTTWIGNRTDGDRSDGLTEDSTTVQRLKTQLVSVATQLLSLNDVVESARWEAAILGEWPYKDYKAMLEVEQDMVAVLALMGMSLLKVDAEWRRKLLHETQIVNPNFISDVLSVFSLVSHSLSRGEPLHGVIPRQLLDRLLYHRSIASQQQQSGQSIAKELGSYEALFYTSAVISVVQLAQCLDELHAITRRLCGEVPFIGFDEWKNEHQRIHHAFPPSDTKPENSDVA